MRRRCVVLAHLCVDGEGKRKFAAEIGLTCQRKDGLGCEVCGALIGGTIGLGSVRETVHGRSVTVETGDDAMRPVDGGG